MTHLVLLNKGTNDIFQWPFLHTKNDQFSLFPVILTPKSAQRSILTVTRILRPSWDWKQAKFFFLPMFTRVSGRRLFGVGTFFDNRIVFLAFRRSRSGHSSWSACCDRRPSWQCTDRRRVAHQFWYDRHFFGTHFWTMKVGVMNPDENPHNRCSVCLSIRRITPLSAIAVLHGHLLESLSIVINLVWAAGAWLWKQIINFYILGSSLFCNFFFKQWQFYLNIVPNDTMQRLPAWKFC